MRIGLRVDAETARMRDALDEATTRLGAIVETAMDPIITVDEAQRIVLFNQRRRAGLRLHAQRGDRCVARAASSRSAFAPRIARHVEDFGRTGVTTAGAWASRPCSGRCAPTAANFRSKPRSRRPCAGTRRYFTVILRDITRRKNFEDALRRQQEELRELSARVLEAREEEKTLIARELHDELGQLLTALKMDRRLAARAPAGRRARDGAESSSR